MRVFLSRLSSSTSSSELEKFAHSILSEKIHLPFTLESELSSCRIMEMEIEDEHGGKEYHGLLNIQPDTSGQWFIKNSHQFKLHHKRLLAHQYVSRDSKWKPDLDDDYEHRRAGLKTRFVQKGKPTLLDERTDQFRIEH